MLSAKHPQMPDFSSKQPPPSASDHDEPLKPGWPLPENGDPNQEDKFSPGNVAATSAPPMVYALPTNEVLTLPFKPLVRNVYARDFEYLASIRDDRVLYALERFRRELPLSARFSIPIIVSPSGKTILSIPHLGLGADPRLGKIRIEPVLPIPGTSRWNDLDFGEFLPMPSLDGSGNAHPLAQEYWAALQKEVFQKKSRERQSNPGIHRR
jgi:hypothetical protein